MALEILEFAVYRTPCALHSDIVQGSTLIVGEPNTGNI